MRSCGKEPSETRFFSALEEVRVSDEEVEKVGGWEVVLVVSE